MNSLPDIPQNLIEKLRQAEYVAVLTGAGISAESGVPTFRDAQIGLWAQYRPEDLATPAAFQQNPELVWSWYAWRREKVDAVAPNPGHYALVELAKRIPCLVLITQNVDGLHQRAGSEKVLELHGNIHRCFCNHCGAEAKDWDQQSSSPPTCSECGIGLLRPAVVWFGEGLPEQALGRAMLAAQKCDVFFSIGTSSLVYPAAHLPMQALDAGAHVVEINPQPTSLSAHAHTVLSGPSGLILPALLDAL